MISCAPLPMKMISGRVVLSRSEPSQRKVNADELALNLMTDFTRTPAIAVGDSLPIDRALECMIHSGVRALFVADAQSRVVGFVTSYDIQGEKPLRHLQAMDCTYRTCTRGDVLVRDIMEPAAHWRVLDFENVRRASVTAIVATFKALGRRHLIVVEAPTYSGDYVLRGLFSATRLEQQLGPTLDLVCPPKSFADVEKVLAHPYADCN